MTAKYVVVNRTLYAKHKHQSRVLFVAGPRRGTIGWLLRKNGSMWMVLLESGRSLSVNEYDLEVIKNGEI